MALERGVGFRQEDPAVVLGLRRRAAVPATQQGAATGRDGPSPPG
ncbi:hypothetical protein [Streptomyces vilmorinianum]|nr:hypothetical protein [Streptomyces vilmorinianum]